MEIEEKIKIKILTARKSGTSCCCCCHLLVIISISFLSLKGHTVQNIRRNINKNLKYSLLSISLTVEH